MSVLNQSGEEQVECPLCMEPLEVDDLNFFPCTCGYQICRFCWHRIRTDENGLCPACRKAYPENPADFKPLSQEEVAKLKAEKRHKDQQRKQKITENRKHLANVRVVQRNLVFVVGLPMRLADSEVLKKHEYFGKFGKIHKVVINQSTSYAGTQGPSASAYVTYQKADDALRAIQAVNNILVDGRSIKSSLGTTKYCSHFMKNQPCPKPDCMYLHDQGDPEASFTKEEMQQGKHQEYERKLHETLINATANQRERKPTPSPPAVSLATGSGGANPIAVTAAIACLQAGQTGNKEAWPSLQPGMVSNSGGSSSSGSSNGTSKGDVVGRKQSSTKNPNLAKKRHSSGDDLRGKTKDKQLYIDDPAMHNELQQLDPSRTSSYLEDETHSSSLEMQSTSESVSLDSDDGSGGKCDLLTSKINSAARLAAMTNNRTATLFEPDNNSFFSTNNFTKIAACSQGSIGSDWPINGLTQAHFPDDLMPVHTTEDWQAAFSSHIVSEKNADPASHRTTASQQSDQDQTEQLNNDQNVASKFNGDIINTATLETAPSSKFILEDYRNDKITFGEGNPGHIFNSLHSQFGQDPNMYMVNRLQYVNNSQQHQQTASHSQINNQHLITNGLPPTQATSKFLAEFHSRQQNQPNHLESNPLLVNSHLDPSNYTKNHLDTSKYVKNIQNMHLDGGSGYLVNNLQSHNIEGSSYGNSHMGSSQADSSSYGNSKYNPGLAVSNSLMSSQNSQRLQNGDILEENGYIDVGNYQRKVNEAEKYLNYQRKMNSGDLGSSELVFSDLKYGECDDLAKEYGIGDDCANDDLGFDPFHETQKGFAEIMGGEATAGLHKHHELNHESNHFGSGNYHHTNHLNNPPLGFNHLQSQNSFGGSKLLPTLNQQQQQQILAQQNHRLSGNVSGCTKLLEGLGLGPASNAAPTRTRLPPPGFSTAPNHMNSFGLGIPRAPTNNGSKILPFMGLGSSNGGSLSPVPPQQQQQSMLFGGAQAPRGFPMPNGIKVTGGGDPAAYSVKDWSENLRGLIPLSGGYGQGPNTSSPPPSQTQFNSHHASLQSNSSKGWTGPCTDWTALDPAIVSSSRSAPHSNNLQPHGGQNPLLMHTSPLLSQHVQNSTHWLRNLEENNSLYFGGQLPDWSLGSNTSSLAAPPPGFSMRQQNTTLSATADMTKIENL